ncbi:DinB family protein [Pedobacter montanisoli]|uniref:DinB family protein n=1 Tax=Pedobacter montanisoli TaxID=2923277 RepID=A0ABS9ZSY1_9SPHI|nr:DinB family protein [Pedobacter montanisoli]MCJ0741711.1 DinB family protein [Pedobacter montanisoli]
MSLSGIKTSIQLLTAKYRAVLETLNPEQFTETPPLGGWSYAEVYNHIFDSSLLSMMAISNCIKGQGTKGSTPFKVKMVLLWGKFPSGKKIKAPERIESRVKKISIEAARQLITDFEIMFEKHFSLIKTADPSVKVKHPVLNLLNARQWVRFIQIHLKHHLKQIERIENSFKQ